MNLLSIQKDGVTKLIAKDGNLLCKTGETPSEDCSLLVHDNKILTSDGCLLGIGE